MKLIHRGEKGFTLIELLVVIAILGVIAAVVALNVAGFFGRGTLQAANTELHQAQTAIVSAMADAENNKFASNITEFPIEWEGEEGKVLIDAGGGNVTDAADYCYGPFKAQYAVCSDGSIIYGFANDPDMWGSAIVWDYDYMSWRATNTTETVPETPDIIVCP